MADNAGFGEAPEKGESPRPAPGRDPVVVAELKITKKHLTVHLSWWEKIGARRSHLTVPLRAIRNIEGVDNVIDSVDYRSAPGGSRGLTRIPGLFVAGTRACEIRAQEDHEHEFSVCRRNNPGLVIELDNVSIGRIVVSTQNAERYASELALTR